MVCQPFFTVHDFNLIDIKVINTLDVVVIGAYLVFTILECVFKADMVALVPFFFSTSKESYSPTTFKSLALTINHRGQTYVTMTPHVADAFWIPSS